ncbi:Origin recognition complex subunit 6 [Penicillium sp. DV-2018c]|nr:Origin recognition complex subunit 6 [Penicillium sp. DV-2018c]
MNNRPVEQALSTLVPTHANDLPQELLSYAMSLVAQSRTFSSSLKPEEEIARPYACAEIACRRLTRTLKLPPLLGRPPCPPRVYKKLYAYLDRSLIASSANIKRSASGSVSGSPSRASSAQTTPTKGAAARNTPSKAVAPTPRGLQNTPSRSTPLKRSMSTANLLDTPSKTARKASTTRAPKAQESTIIPDAPDWVMTAIRTVCKVLSTPAPRTNTWSRPPISRTLPPHIFSGVSSVLYITSSMTNDEEGWDRESLDFLEPIVSIDGSDKDDDFKELVYALVVAVYFLVLARRRNPGPDEEEDIEARKMDKKTYIEMRQTALNSLGLKNDRRHRDDVDQWISLIMEHGWANGREWFENIPYAGHLFGEDEEGKSYQALDEEDALLRGVKPPKRSAAGGGTRASQSDPAPRGGLLPGLGTMMQDRVDWLSDDRREDYAVWKENTIECIRVALDFMWEHRVEAENYL